MTTGYTNDPECIYGKTIEWKQEYKITSCHQLDDFCETNKWGVLLRERTTILNSWVILLPLVKPFILI